MMASASRKRKEQAATFLPMKKQKPSPSDIKFKSNKITKNGFYFEQGFGTSVTTDGVSKVFKFSGRRCRVLLCVEMYDETIGYWTKVERRGEWPNTLIQFGLEFH